MSEFPPIATAEDAARSLKCLSELYDKVSDGFYLPDAAIEFVKHVNVLLEFFIEPIDGNIKFMMSDRLTACAEYVRDRADCTRQLAHLECERVRSTEYSKDRFGGIIHAPNEELLKKHALDVQKQLNLADELFRGVLQRACKDIYMHRDAILATPGKNWC